MIVGSTWNAKISPAKISACQLAKHKLGAKEGELRSLFAPFPAYSKIVRQLRTAERKRERQLQASPRALFSVDPFTIRGKRLRQPSMRQAQQSSKPSMLLSCASNRDFFHSQCENTSLSYSVSERSAYPQSNGRGGRHFFFSSAGQ